MSNFFSVDVDKNRVFGLDFLRAFAIFCVMHGHAGFMLNGTAFEFMTSLPLPHGVDIFFIMSGFLIGKSFISYLEKNSNRIGREKILKFYGRTALRILPNYLFMLLVYYILVSIQVVPGNLNRLPIWRFATFTQNIFTPFWGFYWESWSLPVQWWFYIFFPLLLMLLALFSKPKKSIPWLCLFFVAFSVVYRITVEDVLTDSFRWDIWIRKTMASRVDNIYIGVLAVWVNHYFKEKWERHAVASFMIGMVLFAISLIIPHEVGTFYYDVVHLTLSALAIAFWMPVFTKWRSYKTILGAFISKISILSYAMFLTNLCVVQIIKNNYPQVIENHGIMMYIAFWPLVIAVSYIIHILVEKPFMKLRDRI